MLLHSLYLCPLPLAAWDGFSLLDIKPPFGAEAVTVLLIHVIHELVNVVALLGGCETQVELLDARVVPPGAGARTR